MTSKATTATVMIVDDEPLVLNMLERYLKQHDIETIKHHKPENALATLLSKDIKLVLLDINMPGIDGVQMLKKIKRINPSIRVIMVTVKSDIETARKCLEQGASDYITKPIDFDYLNDTVLAELLMV